MLPFRELSAAETPEQLADVMALAAAGGYLIGEQAKKSATRAAGAPEKSATRGLFNVFQKASESVGIFGLAEKDAPSEMPDE